MSTEFLQKYSYALYEVAMERDDQEILNQLKEIKEVLKDSQLRLFLTHPQIDRKVKKETLERVFQGNLSDYLLNFLYVLIDNKRIPHFNAIMDYFEDLWYEMKNIQRLTIVSAYELSQDKLNQIVKAYEGADSGQVEIRQEVDPTILGGIILKVDNRVIDRSVRGQLKEMEKKLKQSS